MKNIYAGRGIPGEDEILVEMLDEVFFEKEENSGFVRLLPKLYKNEYEPCYNNFVVKENDEYAAAVGVYYNTLYAGSHKLINAGVGNVAVKKAHRSKGYMIDCMNLAMNDIREKGADISMLGGQRQRYGYFGYEPAGVVYSYGISSSNIRHAFGNEKSGLFVREINEKDIDCLIKIDSLCRRLPFYCERPLETAFDVLRSWRGKVFAAFDGESFAGFFLMNSSGCSSLFKAADEKYLRPLLLSAFEHSQNEFIYISVSPFDKETAAFLEKVCEGFSAEGCCLTNVLNYENVIRAYLSAKAAVEPLCDGEIVLLIHGWAGDEKIKISVSGNSVEVCPVSEKESLELTHSEAMNLLFSVVSASRAALPANIGQWLPIPVFGYSCDAV